jgi:hypothetical protein
MLKAGIAFLYEDGILLSKKDGAANRVSKNFRSQVFLDDNRRLNTAQTALWAHICGVTKRG